MGIEVGDEIIETDTGFEFTAETVYMVAPQMRIDLGELYKRAGAGDEEATDTRYSFTIKEPEDALVPTEEEYVAYEFQKVTSTIVDWTMKSAVIEMGPYKLYKQ